MASNNINIEGTKVIERVILTLRFKRTTRIRTVLARWLLVLTNWVAPFEIVVKDEIP